MVRQSESHRKADMVTLSDNRATAEFPANSVDKVSLKQGPQTPVCGGIESTVQVIVMHYYVSPQNDEVIPGNIWSKICEISITMIDLPVDKS